MKNIFNKIYVVIVIGVATSVSSVLNNSYWNKHKHYSLYTDWDTEELNMNNEQDFINLERIINLFSFSAQKFNIPILFCYPPTNHSLVQQSIIPKMHDSFLEICLKYKYVYYDMENYITKNGHLFYDEVHLNETGSMVYGNIFTHIIKEYL